MRHQPRLVRTAALTAATLLVTVTAACSSDGDDDSGGGAAGIEVSGDVGAAPSVAVDAPLEVTESTSEVLVEGEGDPLTAEDQVRFDYAVYNGTTGEQLEASYEQGPQTLSLSTELDERTQFLVDSLIGSTIGSRLLITLAPAADASAPAEPAPSGAPGPTDPLVWVLDLLDTVPTVAEGEAVEDVPAGLPTVQTGEGNVVTGVTVPGGDAPAELVVQPLIQGEGDPVTADDTLTVQYWGVLWNGGETFDSSWERGEPATFPLTGVIPCWTEGLAGQAVGSRVVLVCPSDKAYGPEGSPPAIPADAPLVFVVDILAA